MSDSRGAVGLTPDEVMAQLNDIHLGYLLEGNQYGAIVRLTHLLMQTLPALIEDASRKKGRDDA